jgi:hypothetical protein
MLILKEGLTD